MPSINQMTTEWAQSKNINHSFVAETASTNDDAKANFSSLSEKTALYLSDHQTAGRGRFDREWADIPGGSSLLSTWCFKTDTPVQPIFSPLVGLVLFQSLGFHFPNLQSQVWMKPPNDIFVDQAKLCGLLIESSVTGSHQDIYVGLGMNVFDKPKVDIPTTSLQDLDSVDTSTWYSFCQAFYDGISEALHLAKKEEIPAVKRTQLLTALGNNDKIYTEVFPNGDLKMKDKIISWQDL